MKISMSSILQVNGYESGGNRNDLVSDIHGLSYVHGRFLAQDGMYLLRSHLDSCINNTKQTNKQTKGLMKQFGQNIIHLVIGIHNESHVD